MRGLSVAESSLIRNRPLNQKVTLVVEEPQRKFDRSGVFGELDMHLNKLCTRNTR